MIDAPLAVAFAAGMVAAVNPCGFAMLPAYVGFFLGHESGQQTGPDGDGGAGETGNRTVLRAIPVSLAVSLGFVVVFGVVGLALRSVSSTILEHAPWATMVIGVGLVALGIASIAGFQLTARLPKLNRGGRSQGLGSMFLYGVSYAVASLTCTLGIFLAIIVNAIQRTDFVSGVSVLLVYAAGMSVIITTLTIAIALARDSVVRLMRHGMRHANWVAGVLMVVMGAYVTWYGIYSLRIRDDPGTARGPVGLVEDWQLRTERFINDVGATRLGLYLLAAIVAMVCVGVLVNTLRTSPGVEEPAER